MKARPNRCRPEPECLDWPQSRIDHSLCALVAIDLAAFVVAAWLCVAVPESLEPWAQTANAAAATHVDAATATCE